MENTLIEEQAAQKFYNNYQEKIYLDMGRFFFWLFIIQWIATVIVAFVISPQTWIGTRSQTHIHVWAALILGGAIIGLPLYLIKTKPYAIITRHSIAVAQMLTSALLIHLMGGRLETHFHVFGSLALLAAYRNYPVLITATTVVAVDHLLRGVFWPESVFGVLTTSPYRWIEHAWWVIFEDFFLIRSILFSQKEMQEISHKNAKLASSNAYILREVEEKTKQLETKNAELLHAQKLESIGQLAAGIAHEINTPTQYIGDNTRFIQEAITKILDAAQKAQTLIDAAADNTLTPELIAETQQAYQQADLDYLSTEIPNAISQSLEGISRVAEIVNAMKEFAHPGHGQEKTSVDLNHALQTTMTVARNEWKYVADIDTDFDANLPPVMCMPGEINQVFLNLIVNAAHAIVERTGGQEEKGLIGIQTRHDAEFVEVRISDNGNGIPEHVRARIFDPFFTTKEVGKGSGQGLAIARSVVVDKHQGTIHFETELGKGTTFVIRLPLKHEVLI